LSTTGVFTVTNITALRTIDADAYTLDNAANWLGTIIYDIQEAAWDPADYTVLNLTEDRAADCDSTTLDELIDVMGTFILDSLNGVFDPANYSLTNVTPDYELDCLDTTIDEVIDVLATLLLALFNETRFVYTLVSLRDGPQRNIEVSEIWVRSGGLTTTPDAGKTITAFRDKVRLTGIVPASDINLAVIRAVVP